MSLTLSNTALAPAAPALRVSGVTPGQSKQQQEFAGLVQAFRATTMIQKAGWQGVANALNFDQARTGRHKLSAANAFCILNSGRLLAMQSIQSDVPQNIAPPPVLTHVTADASAPMPGAADNAVFSLTVYALNYDYTVQVLAAAPAPSGKPTFPSTSFAPICVVENISASGTDIAYAYAARYGTPQPGAQIALKLVPISAAGVRRVPLVILATVTAPLADAAPSDPKLRVG